MNSAPAEHDIHGKHHLVLLAGLLCDRTIWEDVAARLSNLAIISIIDFAGFSTIEAMAEHVLGTAPQRFVLVGHSMGGRVALEVMRRAPGRVRGLGLFNTGVHPLASHEPASRGELVQLAHDIGMRKLADRWLPPMLDAHGSTSESLRSRLTAMVERASPAGFAKQIAALLNRPWGQVLRPADASQAFGAPRFRRESGRLEASSREPASIFEQKGMSRKNAK